MDITMVKTGIDMVIAAIKALKEAKDLLPESPDKATVTEALERAERELKIAEAQIAEGLGYELCKCEFPPHIMLFTGEKDHYRCPNCGNEVSKRLWSTTL